MLKMLPKTHITIAAAATVVVTAAILMSPSAGVEAKRMSYTLDLEQGSASKIISQKPQQKLKTSPEQSVAEVQPEAAPQVPEQSNLELTSGLDWQTFDIKSGDTLSSLFKKAGFNDGIMLSVIHGEGEADKLQRLYAGETIRFATNSEGNLTSVELKRSLLETLKIEKQEESFKGQTEMREPEPKPAFASGTIDGSLYLAAREAGLNDRLTMEFAGIFGWDIDFVYDVRKGDRFEVVYEELYLDGEKFSTGRILSARFINRGEENIALLYTDSNGDSDYYAANGRSMRKAFLRTPISARISSSFNLQRRHPVLDVVRPHEGTDYAAPTGSPIKAAGNGRVQFSGWKGGYGRTVVLKHGDNITTLYAHMSRIGKGMKTGARVKQGDTIGYVGSSGMVTGAHLHYEFRVNGSPRNSRTVKLPDAQPIPASEMARFKSATTLQVAQFEAFRNNYQHLAALASED
ncbi:Murein DD-endopeptidase MepM and murein hydrolase activator NlpD, contain LysM domain [Marinobacter sp. LV10R510-11A]|uniref:peptidoglycan DD-metalloendopeptidase family protein n=1 Tax=Marinobacter sp. LV10R510-11A TaxID=1415568 RepID=UPI000BB6DB73|nr:peptidoglycan DD-metalloendopeptidase family protein [Marinobacter sp. LV10R510-11A]SOB76776.1 Murein DD-endopeptidase MepM and murein hydrolase activator NlpD, contain LysM domain [Marinobacter sp. LV10R510-11A]